MHYTGCSGLVHWDDPEGWDGEGESGWGTHVHQWLIHANVWQKPQQNCKVISLQLKKNLITCGKVFWDYVYILFHINYRNYKNVNIRYNSANNGMELK